MDETSRRDRYCSVGTLGVGARRAHASESTTPAARSIVASVDQAPDFLPPEMREGRPDAGARVRIQEYRAELGETEGIARTCGPARTLPASRGSP